jgi:hypothetical protein
MLVSIKLCYVWFLITQHLYRILSNYAKCGMYGAPYFWASKFFVVTYFRISQMCILYFMPKYYKSGAQKPSATLFCAYVGVTLRYDMLIRGGSVGISWVDVFATLIYGTPSILKCKASKSSQTSMFSKFDQDYTQRYDHLKYWININRFTIKYIF